MTVSQEADVRPPLESSSRLDLLRARILNTAKEYLSSPERARRVAVVAASVILAFGLTLPPIEIQTRFGGGYAPLRPGQEAAAMAGGASLEVYRHDIVRPGRIRLSVTADLPGPLPEGHELIGDGIFALDFKGAPPEAATLNVAANIAPSDQAFVDPYGWDGERWRWLPVTFPGAGVTRVELKPAGFAPEHVALTRAEEGATQVAAALLPPPHVVPAAVAELPVLEMRAFHLEHDDGSIAGQLFPVPARPEGRYAIVDNLERGRVRSDLITNLLIEPEARQRHREVLTQIADDNDLAGVILDYQAIPGDLQSIYGAWLARLNADLDAVGTDLIVTVPMPRQTADGWDPAPWSWRQLGAGVDGLRVMLPNERPLEIDELDRMVQWALRSVERRKLQLSVPSQGRDVLDDGMSTELRNVSFGEALGQILDMAQADAPRRLTPAESAEVELRNIAVSELGKDPATGMWRFRYWDANRRPHIVWLNDASGLKPAFDIAGRYRLGRLVLDGVEAGLDPALWHLVETFRDTGEAQAISGRYQLAWQMLDSTGQTVREAIQPVESSTFTFRTPELEGEYSLVVNLVDSEGKLVALGNSVPVVVGPPPLPTPTPTTGIVIMEPTRVNPVTEPPPSDELNINREPVLADVTPPPLQAMEFDAVLTWSDGMIRSGPDADLDELGDVRLGDAFDVVGRSEDGRWVEVVLVKTGLQGWILVDSLELSIDLEAVPVTDVAATATAAPPPPPP